MGDRTRPGLKWAAIIALFLTGCIPLPFSRSDKFKSGVMTGDRQLATTRVLSSVGATAATNYLSGSLVFNDCHNAWFIVWSNVPSAVVIEASLNLTNWVAVACVSQIAPGTNSLRTFEYPANSNTNEPAKFYRLRQCAPFLTAPP